MSIRNCNWGKKRNNQKDHDETSHIEFLIIDLKSSLQEAKGGESYQKEKNKVTDS